jgi:HSP20 family protein
MPESIPIHKTQSILDEINSIRDLITQRAYQIFEERGGLDGRDFENWMQAEHELVWQPAIELSEKDHEFRLEVVIAGVEPKDIEIDVTAEDIVIKSNIPHHHNADRGIVHMCEFASGKTFRSVHLPKKINPDKVKAVLKNGLLRLTAEIAEGERVKKVKPEAA